MSLPSISLPRSLAALGVAAIVAAPGSARAQFGTSYTVSPGLSFTANFGQKTTFGLGLDVRATGLVVQNDFACGGSNRAGLGPYAQITWLNFSHWRFGAGAHAGGEIYDHRVALDGEVGWTYHTPYDGGHPGEHGLQLGLVGLGSLAVWLPSLAVPVRVVLPVGSPVFSPEMIVGGGLLYPAFFGPPPGICGTGRPLRVGGRAVLPAVVSGGRRPCRHPRLDRGTRAALADAWLEDARAECASVPAFVALARDLAAVRAPASLVARALEAARDEVRHTLLCTRIAGDHTGAEASPLLLAPPPPADVDRREALLTLALEAWTDGCLGEGASAARAARASADAMDLTCRAALAAIADDEARHAELAFSVLAHCLAAGGAEVGDALAGALAAPAPEPPRGDPESDADPRALRAHGRLTQAAADGAWADTVKRSRARAARLLSAA